MSKKDETKSAVQPETQETPGVITPADSPASPVTEQAVSVTQTVQAQKVPLQSLVALTGTSPVVAAALKKAFGWNDGIRLTKSEFLAKRAEWLARPAKER